MKELARVSASPTLADSIGVTWTEFWFTPARPWPLALVRIFGGLLALALWGSYAWDLEAWFGPFGMISPGLLAAWRSPYAGSLFDFTTSSAGLLIAYGLGGFVLLAMTIGLATPVTTVLGAIMFASLLHRGPMLVGPADDVVAVTDDEVAQAMRILFADTHNVAEGAGAAALAAAIAQRDRVAGLASASRSGRPMPSVGVTLCGGNVDTHLFVRVLAGERFGHSGD